MAAALALGGCAIELVEPELTEEHLYISAGCATKTQTDGSSVIWSPNDEIAVFYGNFSLGKFTSLSDEPTAITVFASERTFVTGSLAGDLTNNYMGIYPYDAVGARTSAGVEVTVPSAQTATAGSFDRGSFPSVGVSPDLGIAFYNVCGGVRFKLSKAGVKSVVFRGNAGEAIAGTVLLQENAGEVPPFTTSVSEGRSEVTLTCADGFATGTYYYVSLLPAVLSEGFTMEFATDTEAGSRSTSNACQVKRSVFGDLGVADEGVTWEGATPPTPPTPTTVTATLTYSEADAAGKVGGYGSPKTYTNEYGTWTICAYNYVSSGKSGMQINAGKVAYIGTPEFDAPIQTVTIETVETYTGDYYFCSKSGSTTTSGLLATKRASGKSSTFDLGDLEVNMLYIRSSATARISSITVVTGSGSSEPLSPFVQTAAFGVYSGTDGTPTPIMPYSELDDQLTYGTGDGTFTFSVMNFGSAGYCGTVTINAGSFTKGDTYSAGVVLNGVSTNYNSLVCVGKKAGKVWLENQSTHTGIVLPVE